MLVVTSGDTGTAVAHSFAALSGQVDIVFVFYTVEMLHDSAPYKFMIDVMIDIVCMLICFEHCLLVRVTGL